MHADQKKRIPAYMAQFTAETAAEMAKRSWDARRKAEQEAALKPQPAEPKPQPDYIAERLVRTRTQIDMLSDMLEAEEDPNKLDRLANAISRMSELERQLAGRPLPGSLKPTAPRQAQRSATVEPIGPAPQASSIQAMPEHVKPGPGGPGPGQ